MIKMNKITSQQNDTTHFGNGWGLYVDIENYQYKVDEYSNKIIKRNRIYDNECGTKYDYDFDYDTDYYKPLNKIEEYNKATTIIKFTSATLITATVSFMIFYMS
jgi:hypothetical protein